MTTPENMKNKQILAALKSRIGKKVKLVIHNELRDSELGNMNPHTDPFKSDSESFITLLGIYGLSQNPLYLHARDKDGREVLLQNSMSMWAEEESGNPTHENKVTLVKIDDVDITRLFDHPLFGENDLASFRERIKNEETVEKHLDEKILRGQPNYSPYGPPYSLCCSVVDDPIFVEKAIKYLERII